MISREDFAEWETLEVTRAMYEDVREAAEAEAALLVTRRASEPLDDQYIKGYIRGVQAVIEWKPVFQVTSSYQEESEDGQN